MFLKTIAVTTVRVQLNALTGWGDKSGSIHTCGSTYAWLATLATHPLDAIETRAAPVSRNAIESFLACNERMLFQFQFIFHIQSI